MSDFSAFFTKQAKASPHVQFIFDLTTSQVVFVNAAYKRVLHGTQTGVNEELPVLLDRLHPDDRAYLASYWKMWVRGQMTDEFEVRLQTVDLPDQWFCLTPFYQMGTDGHALLGGALRDISAQKAYQANADRFNTRKNAVLEILSHDMSGAFVMVEQITEYLREEVPVSEDGRVKEMLRVLETTARQSVQMIRGFVDIEFLSSVNTPLKASRVEVGATLREPLDQLQQAQKLLGHHFTYSLPTEPVYADLDVNKFTQVLTNLLSNAIKFTPDEGKVAVQIESHPGYVRIHVVDTGVGIPLAMQPHLFEPFTSARRPGLRGEETTGLGLALCKTIVEWHQGTLSVASTEGQGTTFSIEIPQSGAVVNQREKKKEAPTS